jgi:hypothetical protein
MRVEDDHYLATDSDFNMKTILKATIQANT